MITFPRADIFTGTRLTTTKFQPFMQQSYSRAAGGAMITVDFGTPFWEASYVTATMTEDDCVDFQAKLNSLQGGVNAFLGADTRREYPRAYPTGAFVDSGTILAIGGDQKSLSITGLPANFQIRLGDRFSFQHAGYHLLHEVGEPVTASAGGVTGVFEVFPHLPLGLATGTALRFKQPVCSMKLAPNSVQYNSAGNVLGTVSFDAMQFL